MSTAIEWSAPQDLGLPYAEWRTGQDDLIRETDVPGIHVLDLPTGVGKSGIAMGLAELTRRRGGAAFIVVGTHSLQDQYLETFGKNPNVLVIKGKDSYTCELHTVTTAANCEFALLNRNPKNCKHYGICGYYQARDAATTGKFIVVMTYAFYQAVRFTENWPSPDLVVFDEGHNAARHVSDFVSVDFSYKTFEHFGAGLPMEEADVIPCIIRLHNEVKNRLRQFEWFDVQNANPDTLKKINRLRSMEQRLSIFSSEYDETWVTELKFDRASVSPIWANKVAERILYGNVPRVVFMSATIGDPVEFAFELGLEKYNFIQRPSPFPVEHREVAFIPWTYTSGDGGKAFQNNFETFIKKFDAALDDLGGIQSGLKVLVHTVSYDRGTMIQANSKYAFSILAAEKEQDKYPLVEQFKRRKEFTVLVGPCFEEGLDLPDDLCRVNILIKVPYPDMGDKKTRARIEARPSWQDHVTSVRIVQACGRGVRSEDDWCVTWIVDAQFQHFMRRAHFPKWFWDALVTKPSYATAPSPSS